MLLDLPALITLMVMGAFGGNHIAFLWQSITLIIFFLSIFFCIFSEEEIEDEYIQTLRLRSVAIVACIAFLFVIMLDVIQLAVTHEVYEAVRQWRMNFFWNGNFIVYLAVLYLIIFKFSVKLYSKELCGTRLE